MFVCKCDLMLWLRSQFCFTIVYLYCMVAVCQPVIKLMIDWLIDSSVLQSMGFESEQSNPYIKMFSTLSGVRIVFSILLQLDILCTSAVKRYCDLNDNSQYTCHLFPVHWSSQKQEKTCHHVGRTSIWSILYSGELCNKNCIVKTSEMLIVWRAFCYTAGSDKSDAIEGVPDQLLKGGAMMFRVQ